MPMIEKPGRYYIDNEKQTVDLVPCDYQFMTSDGLNFVRQDGKVLLITGSSRTQRHTFSSTPPLKVDDIVFVNRENDTFVPAHFKRSVPNLAESAIEVYANGKSSKTAGQYDTEFYSEGYWRFYG